MTQPLKVAQGVTQKGTAVPQHEGLQERNMAY